MFEPHIALARALERESALLWNLKELMAALDSFGPATKLLPRWQIERIETAIAMSEEEIQMLDQILDEETP